MASLSIYKLNEGAWSWIEYDKDGSVTAAPLPALVERLLHVSSGLSSFKVSSVPTLNIRFVDHRKDVQFRNTFLTCYKAFANAEELFSLLLERFDAVSSPHHTPEQRASVRYS